MRTTGVALNRVTSLSDCGVFRDFAWRAHPDLPEFGRYNLIYGWNGTGKTTISRLFRSMETRTRPESGDAVVCVDGCDVRGAQFPEMTVPIRVFNRDFVAESVFPVAGGDLPPVFVVGPENVEKQKQVDELGDRLESVEATRVSEGEKLAKAKSAMDRFCIERAKVIKDSLTLAGSNPYNTYDKADFRSRAVEMAAGDAESCRVSEEERQRLITQHRATPRPRVSYVEQPWPDLALYRDEVVALLGTTVVSAAIDSLSEDGGVSSWVHEGLALHRDKTTKRCLFCDQILPEDRLAALEAHFNTEYEQLLSKLDAKITEIGEASRAVAACVLPNSAELYDDLVADYRVAANAFEKVSQSIIAFLDALQSALRDKKDRVFEEVTLSAVAPEVSAGILSDVSEVVRSHNRACTDLESRAALARQRLEANAVAQDLDEFLRLGEAVKDTEGILAELTLRAEELRAEMAPLERQIREHLQPAEDLNEDLRNYLGHGELRLAAKDTGYAITRDGQPAFRLSEGEMSAISLLYFLKSLEDHRFGVDGGVVVLDDPVSSLDDNALYLAAGLIRERTEGARQLFILTHSFTFFRQVRQWFGHMKGQNKKDLALRPARFYMLDCVDEDGSRCSRLQPLDPLLSSYESDYHYLFAQVYREAGSSAEAPLEHSYALPNMARRLLEAFLAFRLPHETGGLTATMQAVEWDTARKLRVLRFLHSHSHGDAIGDPEHDASLLCETRPVLNDLLAFMREQDPGHYSAMLVAIGAAGDDGDDG
jgi:wobble nucleotide-excising tRNase